MRKNIAAIAAVGLAITGILIFTKKAGGANCFTTMPMTYHYVEYIGSTKPLQDIFPLVDWWNVIHSYEIKDPVYGWQQVDYYTFIMQHGQYGRIMFNQAVEICGFREVS